MNKTIKTKWVKALRSGEYRQGIGALRKGKNDDLYCCLGVLCDVVDPKGWYKTGKDTWYHYYQSDQLPIDILTKAGIGTKEMNVLISLNDDDKLSFNKIADWIEKHL